MSALALPSNAKILVVVLRRLGDVLLTTPLIRSLRRAWPNACIDALVFDDTAGIVAGNPDLTGVVSMPVRPTAAESLKVAARLWRQYDLAISTQCGDRPTFFAIIAGRIRVAPVEATVNGWLKRCFLNRSVRHEAGVHRVEEILRLAEVIAVARVPKVVCPRPRTAENLPAGDYAVIHAAPMFRYKQWTRHGWRALAAALVARGLAVVATGGPAKSECAYLDDVWSGEGSSVHRVDGQLGWSELAGLLAKARIYVGPDTSVTHLAAAAGCPTVALFGPTDPRLWGPWPAGGLEEPWAAAATIQRRGNIWLVQNPLPCVPCQLEGCDRRLESPSICLDELSVCQVMTAVEQALQLS